MLEHTESIQAETEVGKPLLDKPVLCLFFTSPVEQYSKERGLSPEEIRLRTRLQPVFVPLLITDRDLKNYAFENLQLVDYFGPFKVYQPEGTIYNPETEYKDRESFRTRRRNLTNWCHVPEMDLPITTQPQEETEEEILPMETKTHLSLSEAITLKKQLSQVLDQELVTRLESCADLAEYPQALLTGLTNIQSNLSSAETHKNLKEFSQDNLEPLRDFTAREVSRLEKVGQVSSDDAVESMAGFEDFDDIREILKAQSRLLAETKTQLGHEGVLIPFEKFVGTPSYSPDAYLEIQENSLVIISGGKEYKYLLPTKDEKLEICYKGGLARIVAKIALGEDISRELPPHDADVVVLSKGKLPLKKMALEWNTSPEDIEQIEETNYQGYCATRDSSSNEVLVTSQGVFISFNALSSMYQELTQAADDNTSDTLFNRHIFSVYRPDLITGEQTASEQFYYVGKERFPSPVALSRMYQLLIDGKCHGIVVPQGIKKTDIGSYWLVMARKILSEKDPQVKQAKMERMLAVANFVESPFYTSLPEDKKANPEVFLEKLKKKYPDFDMEGQDDKKHILWIIRKLRNQIIRTFMRSVGYPEEKGLQKKLESGDLDLKIITLPPMEAYGISSQLEKERDSAKKKEIQRTREVISIFDSFSVEPDQEIKDIEQEMRDEIIENDKQDNLPSLNLGKLFYIPISKKTEFIKRLASTGLSVSLQADGKSFNIYETPLSFIFMDNQKDPLETRRAIFEELYHASGITLYTKTSQGARRLKRRGYIVLRLQEGKTSATTLFEEAMAGLEWVNYKRKQMALKTEVGEKLTENITIARQRRLIIQEDTFNLFLGGKLIELPLDFVDFIQEPSGNIKCISSASSHAASLLETIINTCEKDKMWPLLKRARTGDIDSLREIAKTIDQTFGPGKYGLLLKTSADNIQEIQRLKATFAATI